MGAAAVPATRVAGAAAGATRAQPAAASTPAAPVARRGKSGILAAALVGVLVVGTGGYFVLRGTAQDRNGAGPGTAQDRNGAGPGTAQPQTANGATPNGATPNGANPNGANPNGGAANGGGANGGQPGTANPSGTRAPASKPGAEPLNKKLSGNPSPTGAPAANVDALLDQWENAEGADSFDAGAATRLLKAMDALPGTLTPVQEVRAAMVRASAEGVRGNSELGCQVLASVRSKALGTSLANRFTNMYTLASCK
ncbi:MAG TPA: hypothetical protein VG818_10075, partial [Gemmatimonadaceae bacterium]|nr:hypothetical protein [Gemmatimonadaceae bacterium]